MTYKCPECESEKVVLVSETSYMANGGDFFCHSVKTQDSDATARCLDCGWSGRHDQLTGYGEAQ